MSSERPIEMNSTNQPGTGSNGNGQQLAPLAGHAQPHSAVPASLTSSPNFFSLLAALRRRWLSSIALALLAAAVVGVAVWIFLPPGKYTARTVMQIRPNNWANNSQAQSGGNSIDQRTHLALIRSRWVLGSALKQEKVSSLNLWRDKPERIEWLEKEIQADFTLAPEVLRISLSGDDPEELTTLVTAVREAYVREVLDKERIDRVNRREWLRQRKESYEAQLKKNKEKKAEDERLAGKDGPKHSMVIGFIQQQLNWTERELLQTQSEYRRLRAELGVYQAAEKNQAKAEVPKVVVEDLVKRDPEYLAAQGKVRAVQKDMEDFKRRSVKGEKDPAYAKLNEQLKTAEGEIARLQGQLSPMYEEEYRKHQDREAVTNVGLLQSRIAVLAEDEKSLEQLRQRLIQEFDKKTEAAIRLDAIMEDMSVIEKMFARIAAEDEQLQLELKVPERSVLLEPGVVTRESDTKRLISAIGLGSGGAFFLVLAGLALVEFRARRVMATDEVVQGLGMRLVGVIPQPTPRYPRKKSSDNDGEAPNSVSEAVDATRTMLLRFAKSESLKTVMVTSAQSGEGKTSLSTHLAASLAQIGHKTLLIDADLRNPIAHQIFAQELDPGLCSWLRGEHSIEEVIRVTEIENLSMITAGRWDSRATRALAQERTGDLIKQLSAEYEFVIIDTSPILPVVDPLLIGQYVDGVIISVMRDVSRMPNVYAAHQRLTGAGIRVLGAVVNGMRQGQYGSTYGYGYPYNSNSNANAG